MLINECPLRFSVDIAGHTVVELIDQSETVTCHARCHLETLHLNICIAEGCMRGVIITHHLRIEIKFGCGLILLVVVGINVTPTIIQSDVSSLSALGL